MVRGGELGLSVREPTGNDEMFLLETSLPPVPALVGLAERVATCGDGRAIDWAVVPAARLAGVALAIRQAWVGDRLVSEAVCPGVDCGARVDISFSLSAYAAAHGPRRPRHVVPVGPGWYALNGSGVRFRVPSVEDLIGALQAPDAVEILTTRCVDDEPVPARQIARLDRALACLAPSLVDQVGGSCPECGAEVALSFDPLVYTLAELRDGFAGIYRDTHTLAFAYHWSEDAIHRLPRSRRRMYAAMVAEAMVR